MGSGNTLHENEALPGRQIGTVHLRRRLIQNIQLLSLTNTLCLPFLPRGWNSALVVRRRATLFVVISTFLVASGTPSLFADDDHNPIGVTGVFEGMITTGCAYNVLNHNARREIDDIVVPGAIGSMGLR